jgi:glycosyltransferase involved in cell wall biosynthesis
MRGRNGILVMIPYPATVGFAIGRLISVFYEVCLTLTGDRRHVHFAFSGSNRGECPDLPDDFGNLVAFNHGNFTDGDLEHLVRYVADNDVGCILGLDLQVGARWLKSVRRAGARTVVAYWGAPMSSPQSPPKLAIKRLEVRLLHRHRPDLFVFESAAMQRLAVNGRGVPAQQTAVIPTGVDVARFRPLPECAGLVYQRFRIPSERKIVAFMGHLHERKGVRVLLRAVACAVRDRGRRDIHALLLGDRPGEAQQFEDEWAPIRDYVTFGGYQQDVVGLLAGCYAGCIPSTGWDSFPMSSIEMQACGLPVIVSDLQGTPETIENGVTGLVAPAGDADALASAILALVDDPAQRAQMSAAARHRIETSLSRAHQVDRLVRCLAPRIANEQYGAQSRPS